MPFLHAILLWGMFAVSLPVIIHLLNRRKARVIDWGAMRFLELSLATRGRRILLEEVLLLLLRTLLLGALIFALARPLLQNKYFAGSSGANQDVVVLLDGSMSMGMAPPGGESPAGPAARVTYFDQAKDAAERAIDQLAPGDAVAVILGGSTPRGLTEGLTFDRDAAKTAVRQARLTEGVLNVPQALRLAGAVLDAGANYHKQTLLITDGRAHGWRTQSVEDWQALAGKLNAMKATPRTQVLCLARSAEGEHATRDGLVNLAIESVRLSRPVVGTDLPVLLMVGVRNTGRGPAGENVSVSVRLQPDDPEPVRKAPVGKLEPMAAASVQLEVKFDTAGPYRLLFELDGADAQPADNRLVYAIEVLKSLPVLLVRPDDPSLPRERDGARWLRAAFKPSRVDPADPQIEFLVSPKIIAAAQFVREDLEPFYAVVLTNVPRLDGECVAKLAQFVRNGGGLLVAPGDRIDRAFYNDELFAKHGLLPARFDEPADVRQPDLLSRSSSSTQPEDAEVLPPVISLVPPVHGHPAFIRTGEPALWMPVRVFRHLPMVAEGGAQVATVLRLTAGASDEEGTVYAAEKQFGHGRVIALGGPTDVQWSNMMLCDVPIAAVNELIYYLSAPRRTVLNVQAGQKLVAPSADPRATGELRTPAGQTAKVACAEHDKRLLFEYGPVNDPGVYELRLSGPGGPGETLYFTVQRDAGESLTTLLSDDPKDEDNDQRKVTRWLPGVQFHRDLAGMLEAERVRDPGREIWKYVAAAVLAMLLLEIWLSGWITRRRRGESADGVAFGHSPTHTVR